MNKTWRRFALVSLCLTLGLASLSALAQGSWKPGAPIPQGANEVIGANVGGYVLVYGGQDPANKPMGLFWKFDPAANQWTQLPSNPVPVHHGAAVAVGKKIYVSGGAKIPTGVNLPDGLSGGGPVELFGTLEMFDTEANAWKQMKPMSLPRNHHSVAYADGRIYAVGGRVGSCFSN